MWSSGADEKEIYGDVHRSVYQPKWVRQDDFGEPAGMGFGTPMQHKQQPESYNQLNRSLAGVAHNVHQPLYGGFGAPIEANPMPVQKDHSLFTGPYQVRMAKSQPQEQFRHRRTADFFCEDESDDQSSDGGMMMEEEDEPMPDQSGDGLPNRPSHYRRDSTYRCAEHLSGGESVEAIRDALESIKGKTGPMGDVKFVEYAQTGYGQFEGQFYEMARHCEFVISAYSGGERIWVELKHMSNGFNCKQAFHTLFTHVVRQLTDRQVLIGLVDPAFQPLGRIQEPIQETHTNEPAETEPATPQLKQIVHDRVDALKGARYLGEQQALSEEILRIAEDYPDVVAETKNVGQVLLRFFKTAKKDVQLTRTILSLMRKLQANPTFVQRNKQRLVVALRQRIGSDKVTQDAAKCAVVRQPVQNPSKVLGPSMYLQYNGGGGGKGRRHKDIHHHQRAGNHFGGRAMTFQSSIAAQGPGDFMGSGPDDHLYKPTPVAHQKPKASVAIRRNGKAPRFITKFGYYGEQEDKTYDGKCEDEYGVQVRTTTEDKLPTHFVWTEKPDFDYGMPQKLSSTSRKFIHNDIRRTLEELEGGRIKVHGDARNPQ